MRSLRRLGLLGICVAVAVLIQPRGAAAQRETGPVAFIPLEASEGYDAFVVTFGNRVLLETKRKRVAAVYMVPGRVSTNGDLHARFGKLGHVDVSFHPLGRRGRSHPCRREPLELGFFRGSIAFRGEDGYTTVEGRNNIGFLVNERPKRCARHSKAATSARPGDDLDTHFAAISKRKDTVTSFELSRKRGNSWLSLEATRQERLGRMSIFRQSSTVVGGDNAFIASGPGVSPRFAYIAAPKPFDGSALFQGGLGPASWTGSLSAWMPGAGKVALTGPDFATSFCRSGADDPSCDSEPPVQKPFWLAQGSGSQSQALGEARLSWSRYLRNSDSSAGSTP